MINAVQGLIFSIKKYAIHDGPGIRTTIFFKGCPLRCVWCHNPESYSGQPEPLFISNRCQKCQSCVTVCPHHAISWQEERPSTDLERCDLCGECITHCQARARELTGQYVSADSLICEINKDLIFYDTSGGGMTASGGEPLSQPDFLFELLQKCRQHKIHTAVDTSGFAPRDVVEKIAAVTDLFLCDLKSIDNTRHKELTGQENRVILDNIRWLSQNHGNLIIRFPLIPGCNTDDENVRATIDFAGTLPRTHRIDLLPYNPGGSEKKLRLASSAAIIDPREPLTDDRLQAIVEHFRNQGFSVTTGG